MTQKFGAAALVRASDIRPGQKPVAIGDGVNLDYLDYLDGERVSHPAED